MMYICGDYLMDMTTDVSVMVMGLVDDAEVLTAYEAVQVP